MYVNTERNYITEYDALNNKQTITYSKMCRNDNSTETFIPVEDGGLIVYANTCINDGTDKSELLELFLRKDSFNNQKFPNLSDAVQYFKDDEEGVSEVCAIVEEYAKDYAKEKTLETVKAFIAAGASDEVIKKATNLTQEEINKLRSDL